MSATEAGRRDVSLADAEREHREAERAWVAIRHRQHELAKSDATGADGRQLDDVARTLAQSELAEQRTAAAARLQQARHTLHTARLDRANALLPETLAAHAEAAAAMLTARHAVEQAYVQLVTAAWRFNDAALAERLAARDVLGVSTAAVDDEQRERMRRDAAFELPAAVDVRGVTDTVARPSVALWGSSSVTLDPTSGYCWRTLGDLVGLGRKRGLLAVGETIRAALEAADSDQQR